MKAADIVKRVLIAIHHGIVGSFASFLDRHYLATDVPLAQRVAHGKYLDYLAAECNRDGFRILEIGSREVTGKSQARALFDKAKYVGFDYYPGDNVDVVGDAHRLSEYFGETKFDLIFSSATFEHFAMPWRVAEEITSLLKVGGLVFVETHFSYSSHERPWHFFQFTDMGLRVLFSPAMGFECLEAGVSNPLVARFSALADPYLRYRPVGGLYCHSEFLGRKVRHVPGFDWRAVQIRDVVGDSHYPPSNGGH